MIIYAYVNLLQNTVVSNWTSQKKNNKAVTKANRNQGIHHD